MEVVINVLSVTQPGVLQIQCPQSSFGFATMNITGPGEYTAPLGAINPSSGSGELIFSTFSSAVCFEWDSWGLRTLVPT